MNYICPVCFFDQLPYPPEDYHICPCCGTEFENDDAEYSYAELRYQWILGGAVWFYEHAPAGWSAAAQLAKVSFGVHTGVSEPLAPPNKATIRDRHIRELQYA
jgi:hypothetical protein